MQQSDEEKVRELLQPTDDQAGWEKEVRELEVEVAVPVLCAVLLSEDERFPTRKLAATMLGILGGERAGEALALMLNHSEPLLRARAAEGLGRMGRMGEAVERQLIERLGDEDAFVRECSARALGQWKSVSALAALARMSEADEVSTSREAAQEAVKAIGGEL
jgi:HEAT repeat protein